MISLVLSCIRREKAAYLNGLERQHRAKKLWYELKNMNINFAIKRPIPKNINQPDLINDYFMSVYDSSTINDEVTEWYQNIFSFGNT